MTTYNADLTNYYVHMDNLYSNHFPQLWAVEEHPSCGPNNCDMCREVGTWNGVFIGYCSNCAITHHQGKRGRGLLQEGFESRSEDVSEYPSIFDTYLAGINMNDIGDTRIDDSQERIYKQILDAQNEFMQTSHDVSNACPEEYPFGNMTPCCTLDGGYDSF